MERLVDRPFTADSICQGTEMPSPPVPPRWKLPPGVTRGAWEYIHSESVAADYDQYFALNKLFELDEQIIAHQLPVAHGGGPVVADLGCGTGRALLPLIRRGYRGLAIDLSARMLRIVREKSVRENLPIQCLRANLVDLAGIADQSVDHALCLFSTLGMIQGRENRRQALLHARRILKNGGLFILHVHNFWFSIWDPDGVSWIARSCLRAAADREFERGDKYFHYRGVHNMFLHVFTRRELIRELKRAGLRVHRTVPLDARRRRALRWPWLLGDLRANGWIVVCGRDSGEPR